MHVFPNCGHTVHEDAPKEVAFCELNLLCYEVIEVMMKRNWEIPFLLSACLQSDLVFLDNFSLSYHTIMQ